MKGVVRGAWCVRGGEARLPLVATSGKSWLVLRVACCVLRDDGRMRLAFQPTTAHRTRNTKHGTRNTFL